MQQHNSLFKLLSFKGIILLQAMQSILFSALAEAKVFYPSPPFRVSYNDFAKGLPELIFIWELTAVAIMFIRSFGFKRYQKNVGTGSGTFMIALAALVQIFNPVDVIHGFVQPLKGAEKTERA